MSVAQAEEKAAVLAGYWNNFRYDPRSDKPFTLDSKEPSADYRAFITNEVRYSSLMRAFPERAEKLFAKAEQNAKDKYEHLKKLTELYDD